MSFSEQIVYAMFKPNKYKELLDLKRGRAVLFVVALCVVLSLIGFVVPTAAVVSGFGGFEKLFSESMGTLRFQNETLQADTPFFMNIKNLRIVINTENEKVSDERMNTEGAYVAVGSKYLRLSYSGGGSVNDYAVIRLSEFLSDGFSNRTLVEMIPAIYAYLIVAFLGYALGYFIKYAFIALIFSITVNALNKRLSMGLSFGKVFMLCFYGQTLGILISNMNAAIGLLPQIIVSMICIFISVHMITRASMFFRGDPEL